MKVYICLKCKGEFKVFDGQEEAVCPECGRRVNEEKVVHYYRVIVDDDTILFETSIKEKAEKALEDYKDRRVRIKELYQEFPKKLYTKAERSSFAYWFAHWWAVNKVAWKLGVWRPGYLLHDFEKPWLRLIWPYKKVQQWHRKHNRHHLERAFLQGFDAPDYEMMMVDWEAARFTKFDEPLNARQTLDYECTKEKYKPYEKQLREHIEPILEKLGL